MVADDPLLQSTGVSANQLSQVLDLVAGTDIAELDVTVGTTRLTLRRPPILAASPIESSGPSQTDGRSGEAKDSVPLAIASPLVGMFRPAVGPGDKVVTGQTIGRIEALGMPTNVDAPRGGTVEELLVKDGSPVEYGEPLLTLRPVDHAP